MSTIFFFFQHIFCAKFNAKKLQIDKQSFVEIEHRPTRRVTGTSFPAVRLSRFRPGVKTCSMYSCTKLQYQLPFVILTHVGNCQWHNLLHCTIQVFQAISDFFSLAWLSFLPADNGRMKRAVFKPFRSFSRRADQEADGMSADCRVA